MESQSNSSKEEIELNVLSIGHVQGLTSNRIKYTKKSFDGLKDISEALQLFDSKENKDDMNKIDETLLISIEIEGVFENLRQSELQKLNKKFKNKSIAILFSSKNNDKHSVYWKSKEIQNFLIFSPYGDTPAVTDRNFYDFLSNFLARSLANGHLGITNNVLKSAERGGNVELHLIADLRDFNLLLIAAESGRNEIVKILIQQNLDLEIFKQDFDIKAQNLAWEGHHHDIVLTLLKTGTTFPDSFDINECSAELREFCETSEKLHAAIIASNESKIMEILEHSENLHPFYNRSNESAAKIALVNKLIDIYKLLVTQKVFLARHEVFHDFWENYSEFEREKLRKIHFKNSIHTPEKHLNDLINSSSVSHDDQNVKANLNLAQYAFGVLNQIIFIRIILKIVAASKKLKNVIFDFKSCSVAVVDPTADFGTRGLFYLKGIICVAAGFLLNQSTENETFGTLAHELCHYAMNLVYRNRARPYRRKDRERRREFTRIAKICEENRDKEELINLAFGYSKTTQHAELIVRVPHLMALYHNQPEKLKTIRDKFSELFDYYEQKVVPDMEKALPSIEKELERMEWKILKNKIISIVTIVLSIVVIIAGFFVMQSIFYKPVKKFDELSRTDQIKVENAPVNYKNVTIQFQDLFLQNSLAYQNLISDHISQMLDDQILNFSDPHVHYLDKLVSHNWENLTGRLKEKFFSSNFTFQNESLTFEKMHEKTPKSFKFLSSEQIIDVLDGKELLIDKMIPNRTAFYVERSFWDDDILEINFAYASYVEKSFRENMRNALYKSEVEFRRFYADFINQSASVYHQKLQKIRENVDFIADYDQIYRFVYQFKTFHEDFGEVLRKSEKSKLFILSSEAGTGKTTTFEHFTTKIKRNFPTRWVSFIDLKDFTKLYSKNGSLGNFLGLLKEIFDLNSRSKFEEKIFEELFESNQAVLLWNGFDEISPTYSHFILNALDFFHKNTSNIQFVCTRPLYKDLLWEKFNIVPRAFIPFDKEKRKEFLQQIYNFSKMDEEKAENCTKKVYKIAKVLSNKSIGDKSSSGFNTPLMLEMVASLISNDVEIYESENVFDIYHKFVEKKIDIWLSKSEFAKKFAKESLTKYHRFSMMQIYQMYALRSEFIGKFDGTFEHLKIMNQNVPKILTNHEISRMGILYVNGVDNFKFAHKTFAEFFVAQFFVENIYTANDVDPEDVTKIIQLFINAIDNNEFFISIIKNFMEYFLETKDTSNNEIFDPRIAEIFRTNFKKIFFVGLKRRSAGTFFEFLFKFFKRDHKLLVELLHVDENETLYTSVFSNFYFGCPQYFQCREINRTVLVELGRKYLTKEEQTKFINGKNQKGIILFRSYIFYKAARKSAPTTFHDKYILDIEVLKNNDKPSVFELITKNLTNDELKELLRSFWCSEYCPEFYLLENEYFWDIVNSSLTHHEKNSLVSNCLREISFLKEELSDSILVLFNKTQETFADSEIYEIFSHRDIFQKFVSNREFSKFVKTWKFFANHTIESQQKEMLLRKFDDDCVKDIASMHQICNILQYILNSGYKNIVELLGLKKYFNETEWQQIISQ